MKENEAYIFQPSRRHGQEGPIFNETLPPVYGSQPEYSTVYHDRVTNVGVRHIHVVDGVEYEVPAL